MAPGRKSEYVGGVYVLPKKESGVKPRVKEARRGGLLGADRAGTY